MLGIQAIMAVAITEPLTMEVVLGRLVGTMDATYSIGTPTKVTVNPSIITDRLCSTITMIGAGAVVIGLI